MTTIMVTPNLQQQQHYMPPARSPASNLVGSPPSPSSSSSSVTRPNGNSKPAPSPSQTTDDGCLGVRTACNFCRGKKIKCSKVAPEQGGCSRCQREGIECRYDVREPIGRPRKRKLTEDGIKAEEKSKSTSSVRGLRQQSSVAVSPTAYSHASPHSSPYPAHSPSKRSAWPGAQRQQQQQQAHIDRPAYPSPSVWSYASSPQAPLKQIADVAHQRRQQHEASLTSHAQHTRSPSSSTYSINASSSYTGMTPASSTTTTTATLDTPNLSDLGLAAFLESLDTLEINREDGLTANMLAALTGPDAEAATAAAFQSATSLHPSSSSTLPRHPSPSTSLSLANMNGSTSYAVPADLSWADPSWLDDMHRSTNAATIAAPAYAHESSAAFAAVDDDAATKPHHRSSPMLLPPSWPRGPKSGMGQGALRTFDGQPIYPAAATASRCSGGGGATGEDVVKPTASKSSCCCSGEGGTKGDSSTAAAPAKRSPHTVASASPERVHCVPDPTGRGCTCLCDVSVALINVRTTLRQAREDDFGRRGEVSTTSSSSSYSSAAPAPAPGTAAAASTLQLTLTASQAVAAQCACSASCPTCRTDPSTSLSASLLVSTALQIYVRAVRTLRQGFGAQESRSASMGHSHVSGSEWNVSIGQYKPKATNARRIALFAMKLELRDLRDAIAKVSRAACGSGSAEQQRQQPRSEKSSGDSSAAAAAALVEGGVNPIDQVVIRKLHQQLGDLLRTVEGIEEQQDAERSAQSLESI